MTSRSAYAPRTPSPERRRPRPLSRRILIWWRRTLRSPRRLLTILAVVAGGAAAGIGVVILLLHLLPGTPAGQAITAGGAGAESAGAESPAVPEVGDQGLDRVALCEASVPHVNCRCFWRRLEPILGEAELAAVVAALEVRASLGAFAARARLASDIGAEPTRMVNRVLFECTGPS